MRPTVISHERANRTFAWYGLMLRFAQITSSDETSR